MSKTRFKDREDRRDRTVRVGARRRKLHLARVHPDGALDCPCERSVWWFAKRRALGCDCRGRKHGAPKTGCGMCGGWEYRDAVRDRIDGKRLVRVELDGYDGPV